MTISKCCYLNAYLGFKVHFDWGFKRNFHGFLVYCTATGIAYIYILYTCVLIVMSHTFVLLGKEKVIYFKK